MSPFIFVLIFTGIVLAFVLQMTRLGVKRQDANYNEDETELLQELNKGIQRMEQRVEALETILMDKIQDVENKPKP